METGNGINVKDIIEEYKDVKGGDVAKELDISYSTIRKYCRALEAAGYTFKKNSVNHRIYTDKDKEVLTVMKKLCMGSKKYTTTAAADVILANLEGNEHAEKTVELAKAEQTNEIDLAEKFINRMQHIVQDEVREAVKGMELAVKEQSSRVETNNQIVEKQNQKIDHLTENMATKKDIERLVEVIENKDEQLRVLQEKYEALKQNELQKRNGFWSKLFKR